MKNAQEYTEVPTDERQNHQDTEIELVPATEIKDDKKAKEEIKTTGIFELFRFSDGLDKFLMFLGIVCAAINGASLPVLMIIFGEMIDTFVGTGILVNYLSSIEDYLQSINASKWEIIQNPASLNCSLVGAFYGANSSSCFSNYVSSRLSDDMREYAIYYCIIGAAVFVSAYGQVLFWMTASERQGHRIRRACLKNILRQEIGWFDTHDVAELNTRLGDDVHRIQEGLGDKWATFVQWMTCSLVSLIIGFVYGWKQALVILAVSPVLIVTAALFSKLAASVSTKELIAYAKAGAVAEEALGAIRTVVAFGGQDKEAEKYKKNLAIAQAFGIKKGFSNGAALGFVWLAVYGCYGLGFWYGVKLYHEDDDYDIPNVIIVAFNVLIFAFALGMAAPSLQVISVARGAAYIIFQLIDGKSQIDSFSDEGMKPESVTGVIQFENVHFNYPARPDVKVIDGLSFEAKQGQTVALVGSSGCGKSTVVQLLMRFYDPKQGKISIDGRDIKDLNIKWLRKKIGFVSQEPVLFATTIAENVRYGQDGVTMKGIEEACKKANAYDFIMNLPEKFDTLVGERGSQLSGGQKQRLAIARALVRDPKILLLDEATSALDIESESIVQDALDKAREGRTTIVIAHRLSTIKTADIIFGIDNGTVVEMGSHDELMEKKGIYYRLVTTQQTEVSAEEKEIEDIINEEKKVHDLGKGKELTLTKDAELEEEEEEAELPEAPLGRIFKLNASEWPFIALGCFGGLANGTVLPAFAVILSEIIKTFSLSEEDQKEEIKMWALFFLGIGFLSFFTFFLQGYMFGQSGERLTTRLRDMSFRSMLRQDISYFDKNKNNVGALTTRLATDASLVQGVTGPRLGAVFNSIGNMGTALIISFYYGWKMSLVIIGFLPFMILSGLMQVSLLAGRAGKNKEALEDAGKITVESIGNIRTVASLGKEPKFLSMYMENLKGPYKSALKSCYVISLMYGLSQCLIFFAWAASFVFGAYMIEEGEMEFDDVFLVFSAIVIGAMGLGTASAFLPDLGKAQMSARYILQIIDSKPTLDYSSPNGKKLDAEFNAAVTFNDVEFSYPNRKSAKVLQGTTFSASPGETVALVGSSGCGKSTSVQLIERFYDCDAGQVTVGNTDVKDLNIKWLREQMGIVFQEPVLFDTSIAMNIAYGDNTRTIDIKEIMEAARKANIHSFISSLPNGYDTNVGARGTQLSGGQKQRIAIARVLVRNPKILLLDEATSALDTESEKIVQEALERAIEGRTCIVIAHRISTIQNADRICVISQGKVTESGTHNELMANQGFYSKLVKKSVREA